LEWDGRCAGLNIEHRMASGGGNHSMFGVGRSMSMFSPPQAMWIRFSYPVT